MLLGSSIFQRAQTHNSEAVIDADAFDNSKLGQQEYARQYRWQGVAAPQNLGKTAPYDEIFARVYGERPQEPGWDRHIQGRDKPAPMWADQDLIEKRKQLEYTNNWQTPGSDMADARLSRASYSHAPPQRSNRSLVSIQFGK